nr:MAG TPA: hypothetical protein [Caudoviricetes sp.]
MIIVTCSGAFRNNGEMVDFSDLELIMPDCPDEWIQSNAMDRCFVPQAEKKFKKRIDSIHSLYIDNVQKGVEKQKDGEKKKDIPLKPSCCGKKIKSLNWDELQDFAMMFCLRGVPLFRSGDLRTARSKAYKEYVSKIMGQRINDKFDYVAAVDFDVPDVAVTRAEYPGNAEKVLKGTEKTEGEL